MAVLTKTVKINDSFDQQCQKTDSSDEKCQNDDSFNQNGQNK